MILREEKIVPGGLLEKVLAAYQKQGVSEDMLEKLSQDSPLGQVLASGRRANSCGCEDPKPVPGRAESLARAFRACPHSLLVSGMQPALSPGGLSERSSPCEGS